MHDLSPKQTFSRLSLLPNREALIPFSICALPSIFLLAFIPPTLNYAESTNLFNLAITDLAGQRPILYPAFLHLLKNFFGTTATCLFVVLILQHALAILGATYLSCSVAGAKSRALFALFTVPANLFFLVNHGIYNESLASGFIFLFFGSSIRLFQNWTSDFDQTQSQKSYFIRQEKARTASLITFNCFSLAIMTLCSAPFSLFFFLVPITWICNMVRTRGQELKSGFRKLAVYALSGMLALFLVFSGNFLCKQLSGLSLLPSFGNLAAPMMSSLPWNTMPFSERAKLLAKMSNRCHDDFSRAALQEMIFWRGPGIYTRIKALEPYFGGRKTAEQAMDNAACAFFSSPNKYLADEAAKGLQLYMGDGTWVNWIGVKGGSYACLQSLLEGSVSSGESYKMDQTTVLGLSHIPRIQRALADEYYRLSNVLNCFDHISHYIPFALISILSCAAALLCRCASAEPLVLTLGFGITAVLYAVIASVLAPVEPADLLPVNAAAWLILSISTLLIPALIGKVAHLFRRLHRIFAKLNQTIPKISFFGLKSNWVALFVLLSIAYCAVMLAACPDFPVLETDSASWLNTTGYRGSGYGACVNWLLYIFHQPKAVLFFQMLLSYAATTLLVFAVEDAFQSGLLAFFLGYIVALNSGLSWLHLSVMSDSVFFSAMTAILALSLLQLRRYSVWRSMLGAALYAGTVVYLRTVGITFLPILLLPPLFSRQNPVKKLAVSLASFVLAATLFSAADHLHRLQSQKSGVAANISTEASLNYSGVFPWLLDDKIRCDYPEVLQALTKSMEPLRHRWDMGSLPEKYDLYYGEFNTLIWGKTVPIISQYLRCSKEEALEDQRMGRILANLCLASFSQRPAQLINLYVVDCCGILSSEGWNRCTALGTWDIDLQIPLSKTYAEMKTTILGQQWIERYNLRPPRTRLSQVQKAIDPCNMRAMVQGNSRLLSIGLILLSAGAVFAALRLRLGKTEPEISVQAAAISASAWFTYMLAVLSCELVIARYVEVALCYLLVGGLGFSWVCAAKIGKCFVEEPNQPPLLKEIGTAIGSRCGEEILGAVPRPKLIAERTYWNLIQK